MGGAKNDVVESVAVNIANTSNCIQGCDIQYGVLLKCTPDEDNPRQTGGTHGREAKGAVHQMSPTKNQIDNAKSSLTADLTGLTWA